MNDPNATESFDRLRKQMESGCVLGLVWVVALESETSATGLASRRDLGIDGWRVSAKALVDDLVAWDVPS